MQLSAASGCNWERTVGTILITRRRREASHRALGLAFAAGEHAEPEEWRNAVLRNADLWLTVEEVVRVSHEIEAVLEPLRGRALRAERPAGSRRVRVMNVRSIHT